jgi:hypothetical protein
MRANAVPVILADNYVLPFSEAVRWDEIAIFVRPAFLPPPLPP